MNTEISGSEIQRTRELAADADRVIVKAGTNSLTDADSRLDAQKLDKLVDDIVDLTDRDKDVILVSSGAIGAGKGRVVYTGETVEESQALSTVGQSHLMRKYTESFERYDKKIAQLLLTQHDLENPERFTNVQNTIKTLLEWDIVPIINENDAVATQEIRIGDNDMLSSSVAIGIDADLLVTLTDVDGVYSGNPKRDPTATLVDAVGQNYDEVQTLIEESSTSDFGGIRTKVEGARDVSEHGIPAIIAASSETNVLEKVAAGKAVGTVFIPTDRITDD